MLTDNFGRQFQYLRLSITDACNFRCQYCLPNGYHAEHDRQFLSLNEIDTLITAFARLGMRKVRITGGEPGLRKDLPDIISLCRSTAGIEQIALTTNGFNLEKNIQHWADAGLTALNVSADSLDTQLFASLTGQAKLQTILRGIAKAEQSGIKNIKLNAVLLKHFNGQQLDEYLAWIKQRNLAIRFIELMEVGSNKTFFNKQHISGEVIKGKLLDQGWFAMPRAPLAGPAQEFSHPDYQGRVGLIMPYSKDFCQNCNRLRMSAMGKLHLCLFSEQGINIRPWLTAGDVKGTCEAVRQALTDKSASHSLHLHQTGATKHLAMIGG
ncbi:GTP 3',8-cyclase MoaA [Flocculibacter collagenilyticus]|uniref:GTP 3',8-cyclase MoaA n=1 Tax=Flocculibacter collagenilyticus TaxID=2744479 RepID=UPI0018F44049|nr:GTP 3',8-cyclase MoaA [Flocculibacter collagenilyticus]